MNLGVLLSLQEGDKLSKTVTPQFYSALRCHNFWHDHIGRRFTILQQATNLVADAHNAATALTLLWYESLQQQCDCVAAIDEPDESVGMTAKY